MSSSKLYARKRGSEIGICAGGEMEQEQIIPTGHKSKIPHTLSYPVGAKIISEALAGVSQISDLTIDFWFNKRARRHGTATPYRVIRAQYSGRLRFFSASKTTEPSYFRPRWLIGIDAVPRFLRHQISAKIVSEALPAIRSWLLANPHSIAREGGHGIVFTYDELKHELKSEEYASMEWNTTRVE